MLSEWILPALALSVGATLAWAILLRAILWCRSCLRARLTAPEQLHPIVHQSGLPRWVLGEWILPLCTWAIGAAAWFLALLITYEWLSIVFRQFPLTRAWGEGLNGFILRVALMVLEGVVEAIPGLFTAAIIFALARILWKAIARFFDRVQTRQTRLSWLDPELAAPTRRVSAVVFGIFVITLIYPYLPGSQSEAFKGLSVLAGLMLSVGASGLVAHAASGLIIVFGRLFRPGDYVRIADAEGTVTEVGAFTTRIRTSKDEDLVVPNSMVLAGVSRNFSRPAEGSGFVINTDVTIGYDTPWRQVHAMLIEAAIRTEGVLASPAPRVWQTALSDFYVQYTLVCQGSPTWPAARAALLSELNAKVQDVFNEHGVQIMSPHYLADPPAAKVVAPADWYPEPARRDSINP